jgi:tetratricopeptide (TPR) repeat protein
MTSNRKSFLGLLGFILILLGLAYSTHFNNGFEFDDSHTIQTNSAIRSLGNVVQFFTDGNTFSSLPANRAYRPLTTLMNSVDWVMGNGSSIPFHIHIFFWYLVQGMVLFYFTKFLLNKTLAHRDSDWAALLTTAFYMLHPANAETINYIIARSDSFSTLTILAGLLMYIYRDRIRGGQYLYLLPVIAGIYTKQTGVMFAPLLFLYIVLFEQKTSISDPFATVFSKKMHALKASLPAFIVCFGLFIFNQHYMTPESTVSVNTTISRFTYIITQMWVTLHYLSNFILPINLNADPGIATIFNPFDLKVIVGAIVILLLLGVALVTTRSEKTRVISFGIFWFFIALAPTSLTPLYQMANDHRTFFPYVGLSISMGYGLWLLYLKFESKIKALQIQRYILAYLIIILMAYAYGTYQRSEVWGSSESLWGDVVKKSPTNFRGWNNYGQALMATAKYPEAQAAFEQSLKLFPNYGTALINQAILFNAMGKSNLSENLFIQALSSNRSNPSSFYYYASWLNQQGRKTEAKELLQKALEVSPSHIASTELLNQINNSPITEADLLNQSVYFYNKNNHPESIIASQNALKLNPASAKAYNNICASYNQLSQWQNAIPACEQAIALDSTFTLAHNNLKVALNQSELQKNLGTNKTSTQMATEPELITVSLALYSQKDFKGAIAISQKVLKMNPRSATAYNNICVSHNQLKQWQLGVQACQQALNIDPNFSLARNNLNWALAELNKQKPGTK